MTAALIDIPVIMGWILKRKKLGDVKTGDMLIDEDGMATKVDAVTEDQDGDEIFKITLVNNLGVKSSYNATGGHVWPLDPSSIGALPDSMTGGSEATTLDIAGWVASGYHPVLAPVMAGGSEVKWMVASCVMLGDDDARKIKTKCIKVDSPTHTFMLASNVHRKPITDGPAKTELETPGGGVIKVCAGDLSEVMTTSAPTHNCGGPLTLDTVIPLHSGGSTTMGDVKVGDVLIGAGGSPVTVTQVSPVMYPEDLYELDFMEA